MPTVSQSREPLGLYPGKPKPRLHDRVVDALRVRHDSLRTERVYLHWIRRFIQFHGHRHPSHLSEEAVNRFLTHLAVEGNVAASTQNQALAAILFLYELVLEQPLDRIKGATGPRARRLIRNVIQQDHPHLPLEA